MKQQLLFELNGDTVLKLTPKAITTSPENILHSPMAAKISASISETVHPAGLGSVLSLFDLTTNFVRPWAEAGYLCVCVDIQHPPGKTTEGNITKIGTDVLEWLPPLGQYVFVAAWPPCTHLSVSGARWFAGKGLGKLADSIRLFYRAAAICEWSGAPYLIENPVSVISSHWRKPDHTFQPWEYGDLTSKRTCLWTGGGFRMPPPENTDKPEGVEPKVWLMPPSPDRANKRSETPMGFAHAVYWANRPAN